MSPSEKVVVVAVIQLKPGSEDEGRAAFEASIPPTHEEEGCIGYALHQDLKDPTRFVFVEQWASEEALASHSHMPHLKELFGKVGPLVAAPAQIISTTAIPVGDPVKGVL
ncbi:MAG TPA: putative quinol monooxygenase [Baekduia sp.]|jgi:quinol monooxygenase YgiN